jgi:hypothetical protein
MLQYTIGSLAAAQKEMPSLLREIPQEEEDVIALVAVEQAP